MPRESMLSPVPQVRPAQRQAAHSDGLLETICDHKTGFLFTDPSAQELAYTATKANFTACARVRWADRSDLRANITKIYSKLGSALSVTS